MEMLNKVSLRGIVGGVKTQAVADRKITRFTVMTEYVFQDRSGGFVVDVTWHNVSTTDNVELNKGDKVEVNGRLRNQKYRSADGAEWQYMEVSADKVIKITE